MIQKYTRTGKGNYTKALRFIKNERVNLVLSLSVATNGVQWKDDNKKKRYLGFFKCRFDKYKAKALVIGKYKISVLTGLK
ncbi:hypothetical protein [Bacillus atrophaeus]|uniref:hypothetical protein n=1 Tax=Bacillus atrophaeus TaxID=1452 RepID=UPI00227E962F|nr:hypothetical protein [Bacillus atrophaeus]MCY7947983.1 hypothetical protein [Bacillus atrophaeus]MCY8098071.1 hypothetical protein [Bacillus atrophaeus]MCY9169995.1 hypothetical protein [Bacillus atrophaeus]MEC0740721.1 hypothetical protein [Bacillus atrophaeus]MEC0747016.1 hypothetical protein [Bacillus atrophaeus]